jgi:hypothetical protein
MEIIISDEFNYYIPYRDNQLFIKYFKPKNTRFDFSICLFVIHWMDIRGHKGNSIYNKFGEYFSSTIGFPVFIFDILGSGNSKGVFEYPQNQKSQIATVFYHINSKLKLEFLQNIDWTIIPIVHSISIIPVLTAINEGLPIKELIWLGGPPSHAKSLKRAIKSDGFYYWYIYRFLGYVDIFSGKFGLPIRRKLFGFKLRLQDLNKSFSKAHGAKMMLQNKNMKFLAIFGSKDEYMRLSDIEEELPEERSKHVRKIILDGANHSFEQHFEELIKIINDFIDKEININ